MPEVRSSFFLVACDSPAILLAVECVYEHVLVAPQTGRRRLGLVPRHLHELQRLAEATNRESQTHEIVVVGDTVSDMLSGVRAGAGRVVGVLTGGATETALTAAGATSVIGSVAELPALLGLPS